MQANQKKKKKKLACWGDDVLQMEILFNLQTDQTIHNPKVSLGIDENTENQRQGR